MAEEKKFSPVAGMHHSGAVLVQEVFPDDETITVTVPKSFLMTLDSEVAHGLLKSHGHIQVRFEPGVQEIPKFLAEHWWLRANGVKAYEIARKQNDEEKLTKAPDNAEPQPQASRKKKAR